MLVLTRYEGESIKIGDDVTVTFLRMDGRKIRLGIEAPKEVPITRPEAVQAVKQ